MRKHRSPITSQTTTNHWKLSPVQGGGYKSIVRTIEFIVVGGPCLCQSSTTYWLRHTKAGRRRRRPPDLQASRRTAEFEAGGSQGTLLWGDDEIVLKFNYSMAPTPGKHQVNGPNPTMRTRRKSVPSTKQCRISLPPTFKSVADSFLKPL
jgi:hypothetical protein